MQFTNWTRLLNFYIHLAHLLCLNSVGISFNVRSEYQGKYRIRWSIRYRIRWSQSGFFKLANDFSLLTLFDSHSVRPECLDGMSCAISYHQITDHLGSYAAPHTAKRWTTRRDRWQKNMLFCTWFCITVYVVNINVGALQWHVSCLQRSQKCPDGVIRVSFCA